MKTTLHLVITLALVSTSNALADSATWNLNPTNGDWNTAANWTPAIVPNAPTDIATFATSAVTQISLSNDVSLDSIVFNPDADGFSLTTAAGSITFYGDGLVNNSGQMQYLNATGTPPAFKGINFYNSSSAGEATTYTVNQEGGMAFLDSATAGSADFVISGTQDDSGVIYFFGDSTAGTGTFTLEKGGIVNVSSDATADRGTFNVVGGSLVFSVYGHAGQSIIDCSEGGTVSFGSYAFVEEALTTAHGAADYKSSPGAIYLFAEVTGKANFVVEGGIGKKTPGGIMVASSSVLGHGTVTVTGGKSGGLGGSLVMRGRSDGGTARLTLSGNAVLDFSRHDLPPVKVGSIEGEGWVVLGAIPVSVGTNNLSTTFSGVIQDGDARPGTGPLIKVGSGTLTLSGANTYAGGTTVTGGALSVTNLSGSGTGTGPVMVSEGSLGGPGIIAGATAIGAGSGGGAILAPGVGTNKQATLTIQSALTLNSDATYTCTFQGKKNKARSDLVIANGVTINDATLNLSGETEGSLKSGLTLTLISNTSANPISGIFSNLPDGGIITINGNNFLASYEGGDGNDLTLTVTQ